MKPLNFNYPQGGATDVVQIIAARVFIGAKYVYCTIVNPRTLVQVGMVFTAVFLPVVREILFPGTGG